MIYTPDIGCIYGGGGGGGGGGGACGAELPWMPADLP